MPSLLSGQQEGFRPKIGGVPPDGGFALGPSYRQAGLAAGHADFRAEAVVSVKKYQLGEAQLALPRLWKSRLFSEVGVIYRNYPEEDFWGIGPGSHQGDRSNFRQEDTRLVGAFGVQPLPSLRLGATGGRWWVNTGPGKDRNVRSIETVFSAAEVPGLEQQPHYLYYGAFVELDRPLAGRRAGGFYTFRWTSFRDRDFNHSHFQRYDLELRQFVALRDREKLAARARTTFSDKKPGREIPFFMQPTVGGGNDIRGFLQYRFRDENLLLLNLEYRRELNAFLEAVVFGDAGRVFTRPSEFGLRDLRGSGGSGLRLKFRESVFLGVDVAASREGVRVWFRGAHIF